MTNGNGETMRLTAAAVPTSAVRQAVREMKSKGIEVRQSSIILYAIGKLIGIPDDKMAEFTMPRPGRKPGHSTKVDDFLTELELTELEQETP